MKKKLLAALLALGVLASLTACGGKQKTQQDAAADGDTGYADSINILVYPDYVSEDVLAAFEQEYGIQVNVTYLSYEEDNITRVETGDDFDIINPCQETVHQMLQEARSTIWPCCPMHSPPMFTPARRITAFPTCAAPCPSS